MKPLSYLVAAGILTCAVASPGYTADTVKGQSKKIGTSLLQFGSTVAGIALDPLLDPAAQKVITFFSGDIRANIAKTAPAEPYKANAAVDEIAKCKPVLVIFARGTFDKGTIGELVGPPFLNSLAKLVGKDNLGVAGVTPYPADLPGYGIEDGSNQGGASVAKMVAQAVGCKTTQAIILAGWSQGAQVIHKGAAALTPAQVSRISGVILFGDPMNGQPFKGISRVETFCAGTDPLCDKAHATRLDPQHYLLLKVHFEYSSYAAKAAAAAAAFPEVAAAAKGGKGKGAAAGATAGAAAKGAAKPVGKGAKRRDVARELARRALARRVAEQRERRFVQAMRRDLGFY